MLGKKFWYSFYIIVCSSITSIAGLEQFSSNSHSEIQNEDINMDFNNETFQDTTESYITSNTELQWVTSEPTLTTKLVLSDVQTKQESEVETTITNISTENNEPKLNDTLITTTEVNSDNTNNTQAVVSESENFEPKMNEEIILSRKNCNLEITVDKTHDVNIQIKFEPLYNKSYGVCRLSINGYENSMLGVVITNVNLYQNKSEGEILKVIVNNMGVDYVLKQYYKQNDYYPLLLTETNRVYIVLYYNIVTSSKNYSYFNLEVFSYYKYEKNVQYGSKSDSYLDSQGEKDVDQIFFTTKTSSFTYH